MTNSQAAILIQWRKKSEMFYLRYLWHDHRVDNDGILIFLYLAELPVYYAMRLVGGLICTKVQD